MDKDLFDILNGVDVNLDDYTREDLSNLEKKRFKKSFKKRLNQRHKYKKTVSIAAVGIIAISSIFSTDLKANAYEGANLVISNISKFLGIEKKLENYTTIVGKSIVKDGLEVRINEVILDDGDLWIHTTISSDKKFAENKYIDLYDGTVEVDGKLLGGKNVSSKYIDEYTVENLCRYSLSQVAIIGEVDGEIVVNKEKFDNLKEDKDVKIVYNTMNINGELKEGPWEFEFKINGEELSRNTKNIAIDKTFPLENGENLTLEKYTSNDLGEKIYFSKDSIKELAVDRYESMRIVLKGHDDLGNYVEFYTSILSDIYVDGKGEGIFELEPKYGQINKDAKSLTLNLYSAIRKDGELDGDLSKIGEEFTINLK